MAIAPPASPEDDHVDPLPSVPDDQDGTDIDDDTVVPPTNIDTDDDPLEPVEDLPGSAIDP